MHSHPARAGMVPWPFACWSQLLYDGACDQPSDDVSCHNTSDPSCGLLQRCNFLGTSPRAKLWQMLQNLSTSREDSRTGRNVLLSSLKALQQLSSTTELGSSANWTLAEN